MNNTTAALRTRTPRRWIPAWLLPTFLLCSPQSWANEPTHSPTTEALSTCLSTTVAGAAEAMTIGQLKEACRELLTQQANSSHGSRPNDAFEVRQEPAPQNQGADNTPHPTQPETTPEITEEYPIQEAPGSLLANRMAMEELSRASRFMLTPHKRNYFLPGSYHRRPNDAPYLNTDTSLSELNHTEAEMQLSIKILIRENIFNDNGHLYLGYTNHAFWQIYSDHDSAPFRETNHEPELILSFHSDWEIFGFRNSVNEFAINHQSNGQGKLLSRSWNRLLIRSVFERGNYALAITPWYRLPERAQRYPGDPDGDDNPDISDYLGHFEVNTAYKYQDQIFSVMLRNNFSTDNSTVELGWTFPVTTNLRGYLRYFDGYGHSLIDYNVRQQVFGIGIIFTDLF